jgi:hypothetical protein
MRRNNVGKKNNIGACIVWFIRQVYFQSFVSHANKAGVRVNMSFICMNPSSSCWYEHCQAPPSNMRDRRLGKLLLLLNFLGYLPKNLEGYVFFFFFVIPLYPFVVSLGFSLQESLLFIFYVCSPIFFYLNIYLLFICLESLIKHAKLNWKN